MAVVYVLRLNQRSWVRFPLRSSKIFSLPQCGHTQRMRCDFLLLMDGNEWMSCKCSDKGTHTQNIYNSYTRLHTSEGDRTRNRSKNCKCKRAFHLKYTEQCHCPACPIVLFLRTTGNYQNNT